MRGRCSIYDLGTWLHLDRLCSATRLPVHITFSRERFIYLTGNVWPITSWNSIPYTCLYTKEASRRAQDNWTFLLGLCPRPVWDWAQGLYGPGISVPYICLSCKRNILFLFYTPTFIKHSHQFIYSKHLFNKIFILLHFFSISFNNAKKRVRRRREKQIIKY